MSRLALWSDRSALPEGMGHAPILAPFWGVIEEPEEWIATHRFDEHAATGGQHLALVGSPADADLAVLPGTWNHYQRHGRLDLAEAFLAGAAEVGLRTLVFVDCDRYEPVPDEGTIVLRTSLERSRRAANEHAQPAWSGDLVRRYLPELPVRHKGGAPVVGFCGLVAPEVRRRALDALRASPHLIARFVERDAFFGGSIWWETADGVHRPRWDRDRGLQARHEYLFNLVACDYVVCVRGGGNFSHRFYEVLLCGRIPIFVDTDCVLPFDGTGAAIDWTGHAVWCDESDLAEVGDRVAAFHDGLSDRDFVDLQHANRRLWEDRLSAHGFFRHLRDLPLT